VAVLYLVPNSDGYLQEGIAYPGGSHYAHVDEAYGEADDDTTYIETEGNYPYTGGDIEFFTIENCPSIHGISNVAVQLRVRGTVFGNMGILPYLRIGSTNYTKIGYTHLGDTYGVLGGVDWDDNPATSESWVWSDIQDIQVGYQTHMYVYGDGSTRVRCTQALLAVTYEGVSYPTEDGMRVTGLVHRYNRNSPRAYLLEAIIGELETDFEPTLPNATLEEKVKEVVEKRTKPPVQSGSILNIPKVTLPTIDESVSAKQTSQNPAFGRIRLTEYAKKILEEERRRGR
jgi:hypothetical protein